MKLNTFMFFTILYTERCDLTSVLMELPHRVWGVETRTLYPRTRKNRDFVIDCTFV